MTNMRNRLRKSLRQSITSIHSDSLSKQPDVQTDSHHNPAASSEPDDATRRSLTSAPQASVDARTMGSGPGSSRGSKPVPNGLTSTFVSSASPSSSTSNGTSTPNNISRTLSTIRTVTAAAHDRIRPSFEDEFSSDSSPSANRNSASVFSSSVNSNVSAVSSVSQSRQNGTKSPDRRLKQSATTSALPSVPSISTLEVPIERTANSPRNSVDVPMRESSLSAFSSATGSPSKSRTVGVINMSNLSPNGTRTASQQAAAYERSPAMDDHHGDGSSANGWDSTVGKAGLGKTGRVINRLVSDNDALKRDLKIERLKAEESRQAARLLEDKMERMISDYESRLLEASVTKTLLARKERQVESLQSSVELQKKRTVDAQDRERIWREEMEKIKRESKKQVEEATSQAALMEGRYNAISSHWRDQGTMVKQAADRMGKEIGELVEARRQDDDKIIVLRDLCDQQDANIKVLWQQKEDIARKFKEYKQEQERILHSIKTDGAAREAEQKRTLKEAHDVLDKLKWALNVKKNIEWAG